MSDILVKCPDCDHEMSVSEYAEGQDVKCRVCGKLLALPKVQNTTPLKVKKAGVQERLSLRGNDQRDVAPPRPPDVEDVSRASSLEEVYKPREPERKGHPVLGLLTFLVLAALFLWLQTQVQQDQTMLTTYNWFRGIVGGLVYLLVLVVAFEDHLWQGLLSLIFPPYCLYYALGRLDSYVLRSAFFALVVGIGAELYFIPEHAALTLAQERVNSMISGGEQMIQRAGDAPTFQ